MKFDHEQAFRLSTPNALIQKALQMTGSLNTLHTLYAAAQPEQYVQQNRRNELQATFVLIIYKRKYFECS